LEIGAHDLTNTTKWYNLRVENFGEINQNTQIIREGKMKEQVQSALNEIRPSLQADGGDVELVDVEDGIVKVRLTGACGGCPMSQMTLKQGIEAHVKKKIPEIVSVESV
jgi:Fe-S cluster biogenesis protein NfuA